jgi:hypothetical protein
MSRLDKIRERLPQSKSTLEADKISSTYIQSDSLKSTTNNTTTTTTKSPSLVLSSEAETERRINLVKQFLKENEGIRMMWLNAYWALHFVVFASSLYLLLVHFENPYMGDGALLLPFKGRIDEIALITTLSLIPISMVTAAYAGLIRARSLMYTALAITSWPCFALFIATIKSGVLIGYWLSWTISLAPPAVIGIQIFAEIQFKSMETGILEAYDRVQAEDAEERAAALGSRVKAAAEIAFEKEDKETRMKRK